MCYKSSINIRCHLNELYRSRPAPNRNLLFGFVAASLCLLLALPAFADGSGRFEIVNADFRADDGIWVADARADLELSDEAFAALENGVALTIQYQFTVTRARTLWPDKRIVEHKRDIELQYNSLSRRYVVRDLNTGEQASYATVFSALRQIGRIRDFPILPEARIDPDDRYNFSMRVVLNREKLPGPMQVLVFWRGDFSLESEWFRWTLK